MDLFRLDEYNDAVRRVAYRWIDARTTLLAPSLSLFPRQEVEYVRTSRSSMPDGSVQRVAPVHNQDGGRFDIRRAVEGDFEDLKANLEEVAQRRAKTMVAFWQELEARGLTAGSVVKAAKGPSWDTIMDGLEELALTFDDAGEPVFHIVAGTASGPLLQSLGARSAAEEQRWQELMARKGEEARARQRHRRMA
jgi:hypothetical protein